MRKSLTLFVALLLVGAPSAAAAPRRAHATRTTLQGSLTGSLRAAGGASGAYVVDLNNGRSLYSSAPGIGRFPASVEKVFTTSVALLRFGSGGTLTTTLAGSGYFDAGRGWHGTLYLRGGGDPTFGSASYDQASLGTGATMQQLVTNLKASTGMSSLQGSVAGDESFFDSLRGTVYSGFAASTDIEGLLSGLAYDRGCIDLACSIFQGRPALYAAQHLPSALRAGGVSVPGGIGTSTATTPRSAQVLATVSSPSMATLIRLTNTPSDNYLAESLLKDLGGRFGGSGSSAAGAAVVRAQLARSFGIHPRVVDGSGLSRGDLASPAQVVAVLRKLAGNSAFVRSLAVAGLTGTMRNGLQNTPAQGRCRGKTGTLSNVGNLVGYCTARNGHTLAFAFLMNAVNANYAHALEYRMAVALATYSG